MAKLDFGIPGQHVQKGFHKIGRGDSGSSPFTGSFPCFGDKCTIKINGHTHTRGNYASVTNSFKTMSNLLRSSFLRNKKGKESVNMRNVLHSTFLHQIVVTSAPITNFIKLIPRWS